MLYYNIWLHEFRSLLLMIRLLNGAEYASLLRKQPSAPCGAGGNAAGAIKLVEALTQEHSSNLLNWLVLSDLRLGDGNGVEMGRTFLEASPDLRVVIYTQDPVGRWQPKSFAMSIRAVVPHVVRVVVPEKHLDYMDMRSSKTWSQPILSISPLP